MVLGVEGLKSVAANKIVYCTIEVEGEGKLQTEHVEASKPVYVYDNSIPTFIPFVYFMGIISQVEYSRRFHLSTPFACGEIKTIRRKCGNAFTR